MDQYGNVLAISRSFDPEVLGERWQRISDTRMVQLSQVATPIVTPSGEMLSEWPETPAVYVTEEANVPYIASSIVVDGENVAVFIMEQLASAFTPAKSQLARVLCEIVKAVIAKGDRVGIQSHSSILLDLLEGESRGDGALLKLQRFNQGALMSLIVMRSIRSHTPHIRRGSMVSLFRKSGVKNISLIYGEDIISVVTRDTLGAYLSYARQVINERYYMIGLSMPFSDWENVQVRYKQACFALEQGGRGSVAGVYDCRDYAYENLVSTVSGLNYSLELRHPALDLLSAYDKAQGTDLAETLYQFLVHERNLVNTAKKLFIHRNTLIYRIKRIEEIAGVDFENLDERTFILLSYKMKDCAEQREGGLEI